MTNALRDTLRKHVQIEQAETELGKGLDSLRAAAAHYETADELIKANDIRETLEALRKRIIG